MQRGRGKVKDLRCLFIDQFIHSFIYLFIYIYILFIICIYFSGWGRLGRGESEDHGQSRSRLAFGLPGEVHFTISPLQRIEGHTQAIKIISIGRHK